MGRSTPRGRGRAHGGDREDGSKHPSGDHEEADRRQEVEHEGEGLVPFEEAPATEDEGPVVDPAADQGQGLGPGVGHVAGDVREVLEGPAESQGDLEILLPKEPTSGHHGREHELAQRPAVEAQGRTEQPKDQVPRLVEGEVGVVEHWHEAVEEPGQDAQTQHGRCSRPAADPRPVHGRIFT